MGHTRDRAWLALLAGSFGFGLAASWQRWANPLIDTGREMNQPLRLAAGERLYADVRHIYGPLSPWLHAWLYRLFGPSLTVLYADGILTATVILSIVYWLGRQFMSPAAAGAATLSVMWLCVFKPAGNYILPYSYNALHGAALGLITLAMLVAMLKHTGDPDTRQRASAISEGAAAGTAEAMATFGAAAVSRASNSHPAAGAAAGAAGAAVTAAAAPALRTRQRAGSLWMFLLAGIVAGLAMLAKTEMGLATLTAGVTAAWLAAYPDARRGVTLAAAFIAAAATMTVGVYAIIAAHVGWSALIADNWLLLYNIPPELAYYNERLSGLDRPLRSIARMLIAAAKVGIVAAIIGALGRIIAAKRGEAASAWRLLAAAGACLIVMSITSGLDLDKGPFLAMPFLLIGSLAMSQHRFRTDIAARLPTARTAILITCTVYALASIARMILHVRSGGAYGAYLLPVSVVIFTYLWMEPFPALFRDARAGRIARTITLIVIFGNAIISAGILAYRYQARSTVPISTARGTMITTADMGDAWNEALAYIDQHTRPGDAVAVMPEGTSLDFLSGRRNPLREEITTPGFLDAAAERRAIAQLDAAHTDLILIPNRPTTEFGPVAFGRDYNQRLMQWIDARYTLCAMFGPVKDTSLDIGDKRFFIRAYCAAPRAGGGRATTEATGSALPEADRR
jgi:uncharacterized membrane protein